MKKSPNCILKSGTNLCFHKSLQESLQMAMFANTVKVFIFLNFQNYRDRVSSYFHVISG